MNVLTGVGILLLSMLIMVFLQLTPGIFMIFEHYVSAKFSKKIAADLTLFYIFGIETVVALLFISLYFIVMSCGMLFADTDLTILAWILIGVLSAIGIVFPFIYFRRGQGTRLFISRNFATKINNAIKKTKTRSGAFMLGAISVVPELIFTLPIYLISVIMIMEIGETAISRSAIILLFMFAIILPLFVIRVLFEHNHNLANLQKSREKNKTFFKFMIGILYLLIVALLITRIYR